MSPRLLFYVQHLLGVGHVKRAAAIARAAAEHLDVHVVLGGEDVALADFSGCAVHRLPAAKTADLSFKVLLDADGNAVDDAWRERRRAALLDLAAAIDPQVLLVEHYPFGRGKFGFELLPLFELIRSRPGRRILASVRDVLVEKGEPRKTAKITALVRQWFDAVLVHGDPAVIPFEATFPAAAKIADLIEYTGYVTDGPPPTAAGERNRDGEIVVSIGGGAVGRELLETALDVARCGMLAPRSWRLLAGAGLSEADFNRLKARAGNAAGIVVERARPDFRDLLGRAGLSISQAGYNTVMDLLATRCPALVVPFAAEAESEQLFRAREFERRGLVTVLEERELQSAALAAAAVRALNRPPSTHAIDLDGARGTAAAIARWAGP